MIDGVGATPLCTPVHLTSLPSRPSSISTLISSHLAMLGDFMSTSLHFSESSDPSPLPTPAHLMCIYSLQIMSALSAADHELPQATSTLLVASRLKQH